MTDRAQFEAMLEALINEDHEQAKEIFHNIVVGKSREIYQELLESDFGNKEEEEEESVEESEEEGSENPFGGSEEEESEEEEGEEEDGDEEGEEPEFGDEEEGEEDGDIEDRVLDLEDALEDLKAEFEQLLAGEEAEEADHPGIHDMGGADMGDELGGELDEVPMMEYVNKVALPKHGDNGVNTKSAVAGKNDMGGTAKNLAQSFSTEKGGTEGGLAKPKTELNDFGNINKPGANAGKSAFKHKEPGHGAEKKGSAEKADNKKSLISTKVR